MIATLAQTSSATFWMPEQASTFAGEVDWLFYFILWVCIAMFVLVTVVAVAFVWKYRARPGHKAVKSPSHSTALELTWTVAPTAVLVVMFFYGFRGFLHMVTPPPNTYDITVTASKWNWQFTYPNGYVDQVLHVPKDRPVRVVLTSQDVIHSLYIPAFRVKKDCVPGRYNKTWFEATKAGEFDLYCAEYCGTKHSAMLTKVVVQDPSQFTKWLEEASNWISKMPPAEAGQKLYGSRGCSQCHSVDGKAGIAPSLKNIFGEEQMLRDGSRVPADEDFIRESILDPGKKIIAGFDNVMPTYQGRLKDNEITALIAYLRSISDKHKAEAPAAEPVSHSNVHSSTPPQPRNVFR